LAQQNGATGSFASLVRMGSGGHWGFCRMALNDVTGNYYRIAVLLEDTITVLHSAVETSAFHVGLHAAKCVPLPSETEDR
jgi:hypothetical protein